jgi:hypothetical protein
MFKLVLRGADPFLETRTPLHHEHFAAISAQRAVTRKGRATIRRP